jgi:hypothetical protein
LLSVEQPVPKGRIRTLADNTAVRQCLESLLVVPEDAQASPCDLLERQCIPFSKIKSKAKQALLLVIGMSTKMVKPFKTTHTVLA